MKKTLKLLLASIVMLVAVVGISATAMAEENKEDFRAKLQHPQDTKPNYDSNITLPRAKAAIPTMKLGGKRSYTFANRNRDFDMAQFQTTSTFTSVYNIWITNHAKDDVTVLVMSLKGDLMGYVTAKSGQTVSGRLYLEPNVQYYIGVETTPNGTSGPCEYGISEVKSSSLKIGTTYNRTLKRPDEIEFVKFTTNSENAYYHLYFKNTVKSEDYEVSYYIMDSKGNYVYGSYTYAENGYNISRQALKLKKNQTYYIAVMGFDYEEDNTAGRYTISVKKSVDHAGNTKSKARTIKVNKTYSANIDYSSDIDWYKFQLGNYQSVKFNIAMNLYNEDGDRAAARVTVYDSKGRFVDTEYIIESEKNVTFKGTYSKKGTYYLKVEGRGAELGNYKITVRNPGSVSVAKPTSFAAKKASKTAAKVSWKEKSGVSGYQIYCSYNQNSGYVKVKTLGQSKSAYTKNNLKKGKTYYFKMRSYKKVGSLYYYSKYTTAKKVTL